MLIIHSHVCVIVIILTAVNYIIWYIVIFHHFIIIWPFFPIVKSVIYHLPVICKFYLYGIPWLVVIITWPDHIVALFSSTNIYFCFICHIFSFFFFIFIFTLVLNISSSVIIRYHFNYFWVLFLRHFFIVIHLLSFLFIVIFGRKI